MGVLDWFQQLSPQAQAALMGGGMNVLGGVLGGMGQEGQQEDSQAHQLEIARMNNMASLYGADNARYIAAQNALGSPLSIQRERAGMAMLGDMLGNRGGSASQQVFAPAHIAPSQGRVGGGAASGSGGLGASAARFLTPDSLVNAEVPFWQNLSALNPDINANLRNVGYGQDSPAANYASGMIDQSRLGNMQRQGAERQAVMGALGGGTATPRSGGPAPKGYEYDKKTGQLKKKGGGFWKTLGKIGLGIGGGIATAMTGGAAAPLLGAAFGAASGAIDNGWRGALTGGALGGLTGGLGGGAAQGAKQGLGAAVKSTLTNPQVLARSAGQGIGGPVGTALQLGSTMMPTDFTPGTTNGLPNVLGKNKLGTQLPGQPARVPGPYDNVPWGFGGTMGNPTGAPPAQAPSQMEQFLQQILGGGQRSSPTGQSFVDPNPQRGQDFWLQTLLPLILGMGGRGAGSLPIQFPRNPMVMY